MLKILNLKKKNYLIQINGLLKKRQNNTKGKIVVVKKIIDQIKKNGDKALIKYEKRFSKNSQIISKKNVIKKNIKSLDPKVKKSIDIAYNRILKFHSKQKIQNILRIIEPHGCGTRRHVGGS